MKGIVNRPLNERELPDVNSLITHDYATGDYVEVIDAAQGTLFDGEDRWFELANGRYVWSGGVDVQTDYSMLDAEDRDQYLLSFRKTLPNAKPDLSAKEPPDKLYFAPVRMPFDAANVRVNELLAQPFANSVVQAVKALKKPRKHVMIYIHGYQMFSSLKLDLLSGFAVNYMHHAENTIAKVLFMTWPAQSLSRKTIDDRAIKTGEHFTQQDLFKTFEVLASELRKENKCLNLMVHSFGHQLLNGMLNPLPVLSSGTDKIFENIFLMAPDVTHLTIQEGGKKLPNYFGHNKEFLYHYKGLNDLAKNVHVFHDKYDYLLYTSTKKSVKDCRSILQTDDYRNLGNYGDSITGKPLQVPDFNYIDVQELVTNGQRGNPLDYPYEDARPGPVQSIENVWKLKDYGGIDIGDLLLNMRRFPDHHRYLFTSKPVVDKVLQLLH